MSFAQGHALLIGVGSHAYIPTANVPVTVADATALAELLRDDNFCGYPPKQMKLLHDAGASKDDILANLDLLAAKVKEDDTVFFFYCGHGEYGDDDSYYLVSHDAKADLAKRKIVAGTGVRDVELMTRLKALKAKRVLIVINACHSGELSPSLSLSPLAPTHDVLGQTAPPAALKEGLLGSGSGRIIITACGEAGEKSWVGTGPNTIFAEALLDGLRCNGVASHKGCISAFDLYTHIYETVKDKVAALNGQNQNPELTVIKGIGPFAVALCKGSSSLDVFDEPAVLPTKGNVHAVDGIAVQNVFNRIMNNTGIALIGTTVVGDVVMGDKVGGNKIKRQINQGAGSTYVEGNQINQPGAANLNPQDVKADK